MKTCPTCDGSGKVITAYKVVCIVFVAKVEECPDGKGKGYLNQTSMTNQKAASPKMEERISPLPSSSQAPFASATWCSYDL